MSSAHTPSYARFPWERLLRFAARFTQKPRRLDPRTLPEHLQRDLGYVDGTGAVKTSFHLDEISAQGRYGG